MALSEMLRRVKAFLESDKPQAQEELNRRMYTISLADLDGIYYDEISGFPSRHWGGISVAAVAGQLPFVQLLNPTNSGADVIPEVAILSSPTAQLVELRLGAVIGSSSAQKGRRDSRGAGSTIAELRSGTEAAASGGIRGVIRLLAATPTIIAIPSFCVLGSAIGFHFEGTTVNTGLDCTYFWRELVPGRNRVS